MYFFLSPSYAAILDFAKRTGLKPSGKFPEEACRLEDSQKGAAERCWTYVFDCG
jgi:hypothetical protein